LRPALARAAAVGLVAGGLLGACETVDLGAPPADVNACRPSQSFFVKTIWTNVLSAPYGAKHCADAGCHAVGSQNAFTLIANPLPMMAATDPVPNPLPDDWSANYLAASQEMSCDDPSTSKLIITPTNPTHGGGMLFATSSMEVTDLTAWVTAP
jgi:hypothetical protein